MTWFGRRAPSRPQTTGPLRLESGRHRSPGIAALVAELGRRRLAAILDLGPPSTQNVDFLSRYADHVAIQDLYRSARSEQESGGVLGAEALPLPDEGRFDLLLAWDLLHYFEPRERRRFGERLAELARPGALLLLVASNHAPVPPQPIHFKVIGPDTLEYTVTAGPRLPAPGLRPRDVERFLPGFRPLRSFQLRTGLQEFVMAREEEAPADGGGEGSGFRRDEPKSRHERRRHVRSSGLL